LFLGLHVAAAGLTLQQLYFYYRIVLRAEKRFVFQSKIDVFFASLNVPVTIALVVFLRLRGLYLSYVLVYLVLVGYLARNVRIRLRWPLNRSLLADLVRIGFPAYLLGLVYTLFMSVDRMVIVGFLTSADMGYYTISLTLIQALGDVAVVVSQVMSPSLVERYSQSGGVSGVYEHVRTPTLTIAAFFPVLQVGATLALLYALHYVLPKFLPGATAITILIMGGFFIAVMRGSSSFLLAMRRQGTAVAIYAACVALALGLNILLVKAGMGLVGVALATVLAYFALYLLYQTNVFYFFYGWRLSSHLKLHARAVLPFALSLAIYLGLERVFPFTGDAPIRDALRVVTKLGIFLALYTPLAVYYVRDLGLWKDLVAFIPWVPLRTALARWSPKT
jgi:O-antigen/teichoic acid export membrane protein